MRIFKNIIIFSGVLLIVSLWGCSASKPVTVVKESSETTKRDETFDPLLLQDEDIVFPEESPLPESGASETLPGIGLPGPEKEINRQVDGFRVQVYATKDIERATLEKKQAEFQFLEDSVAVYIEFDSPMYKVRVGDFVNRDDAVRFKQIARAKGYREAWIVKTKVNTHPTLPKITDVNLNDLQQ